MSEMVEDHMAGESDGLQEWGVEDFTVLDVPAGARVRNKRTRETHAVTEVARLWDARFYEPVDDGGRAVVEFPVAEPVAEHCQDHRASCRCVSCWAKWSRFYSPDPTGRRECAPTGGRGCWCAGQNKCFERPVS